MRPTVIGLGFSLRALRAVVIKKSECCLSVLVLIHASGQTLSFRPGNRKAFLCLLLLRAMCKRFSFCFNLSVQMPECLLLLLCFPSFAHFLRVS